MNGLIKMIASLIIHFFIHWSVHFRRCYLCFPVVRVPPPQYLESMRRRVTEQYFTCRNGVRFPSPGDGGLVPEVSRLRTSTQYVSKLKMESWQPAGTPDIPPLSRSIWINPRPPVPPPPPDRELEVPFRTYLNLRHPPRGYLNRAPLFKECRGTADRRYTPSAELF